MNRAACRSLSSLFVGVLALAPGLARAGDAEPAPAAPAAAQPPVVQGSSSDGCSRHHNSCDHCSPWAGPFAGFQVGYGWGNADTRFDPLPSATAFIDLAPTTLTPDPSGFFGGIHAGYNWQRGALVLGAVADFNWSNLNGSQQVSPIIQNDGTPFSAPGNSSLSASQHTDWFGSVRARAGVASERVLLYGTAGFAFGHVDYAALANFRPQGTTQYPVALERSQGGWTVGAGIEVALSRRVTWKIEYLYYDLGSENLTVDAVPALPPFQIQYNLETKAHLLSTGLSFRF